MKRTSRLKKISRREFAKGVAAGAVGAAIAGAASHLMRPKPEIEPIPTPTKPIVTSVVMPAKLKLRHDPNLCRGCGICELACSLDHEGVCSPALSRIHIIRDSLGLDWSGDVCHQCDWPECYFSCPISAIGIDRKTGARYIDESICVGCGTCSEACPFMPKEKLIKSKTDRSTRFFKCDLCKDREKGPICVEYCPRQALSFIPAEEK